MSALITVFIVNYNSAPFTALSFYALNNLSKNQIIIKCLDNGSNKSDIKLLRSEASQYKNITLTFWKTKETGSIAHAKALNHLTQSISTPYFSILDADATWLIKNWDEYAINEISKTNKVFGTQAAPGKPQDFPLMYASFFETDTFTKMNINFLPKNINIKQDTGYEMREKYLVAGYTASLIHAKYTRAFKSGPYKDLIVAEYYHPNHIDIFASHFSRGSELGQNKYKRTSKNVFYKIPLIGDSLLLKKGTFERDSWISISRKIIQNQ